MGASHRAGSGPMWVNQEHTDKPLERTLRAEPQEYAEEGVNFPYRGVEEHGVPFKGTIPDELEGSTDKSPDLVLPPHLAEPMPESEAVPVRVVADKRVCRIAWEQDSFVLDTNVVQVVGRNDTRKRIRVSCRKTSATFPYGGTLYVGPVNSVNPDMGFALNGGDDIWFETTEAIYAVSDSNGATIDLLWEYYQEA